MLRDQSVGRGELAEPIATGIPEAERLLGMKRTELYGLIGEGKIEARKQGQRTLILVDSLRGYLNCDPRHLPQGCRPDAHLAL